MMQLKKTINKIKTFLIAENHRIAATAFYLIIISIITKLVGMISYTLITRQFGAGKETDLFFLASIIPETITNIILLGVISGSVIPIFIKIKEKEGEKKFLHSFSATLSASMLFVVILILLAAIFAKELIPLALSLANKNEVLSVERTNEIIAMMRVLLIPQILLALSAFYSSWLNIYHRFVIPQLAPLFFNIGRIIGIVFVTRLLNGSIWGLVYGTLIGAILHIGIQLPLLKYLKFPFKLVFDFKDKSILQILKLGLPRMFSLGMEQFASIFDSIIALSLPFGSLTAYQLAIRLINLPLGLFGANYAIASFPTFTQYYTQKKYNEFSDLFYKIIKQIIFLSLPIAVIFIVMRVPIVRLVYGIFGGEFSWEDTLLVAWVVLFYALGITFEGMRTTMFKVFFAVQNTIIPLLSSLFVCIAGITTGILFTNYFSHFNKFNFSMWHFDLNYFLTKGDGLSGAAGLALSSSVVFTLEFFILLFILRKKGIIKNLRSFFKDLARMLFIATIMFIVCYAMSKLWEEVLNTTKTIQLIFLTVLTIFSSLMVYIWCSYVFKVPEGDILIGTLIHKVKKIFKK